MATIPATGASPGVPELVLGWLWLASVTAGGLLGGLYAAATTKLSVGAAMLLLPFLHVVVSIPVFLVFLFGVVLVRRFYRGRAQTNSATPSSARAWALLVAWASLHACVLYAMTAFPFLTVLSFTSALIAWACCLACTWWLRAPVLAYLMDQTHRRGMSWVDRRYAHVHGNLRDWQK